MPPPARGGHKRRLLHSPVFLRTGDLLFRDFRINERHQTAHRANKLLYFVVFHGIMIKLNAYMANSQTRCLAFIHFQTRPAPLTFTSCIPRSLLTVNVGRGRIINKKHTRRQIFSLIQLTYMYFWKNKILIIQHYNLILA